MGDFKFRTSLCGRLLALALIPLQLITSSSVVFAEVASGIPEATTPGQNPVATLPLAASVVPNSQVPRVTPPSPTVQFSSSPTTEEIRSARIFEEPLVPNGKTNSVENAALAAALVKFSKDNSRGGLSGLEAFAASYPQSAWAGSVQADLGLWYRHNGYYSRAIQAWQAAWTALKSSSDPLVHPLADRVAGELAALYSSLGRTEQLDPFLEELKKRPTYGSAIAQIQYAGEDSWLMHNRPGESFKCGPYALDQIRTFENRKNAHDPAILSAASSSKGFSLDQVEALATKLKMNMQMARREPGADIITPAVVHWKSGHYAAMLKEDRGTYLVKDPTFGRIINFSPDAVEDEADGYFLVPKGPLPKGWQSVGINEAKKVWGRGQVPNGVVGDTSTVDTKINPNCPKGMMAYSVFAMVLSLSLSDTPLFYDPPAGPKISFEVTVNQLEANQPATFTYSNLGPLAVDNWMSFVTAPSTVGQTAYVNLRGGGQEIYSTYTAGVTAPNYVGSYAADPQSLATLWVTSTGSYERHFPDGSKEVYSTPDGTGRIFLNQVFDPQGNAVTLTYDSSYRLVSITDAIGQVTTLSYTLAADPLKITKVTDPFGRYTTFGYSSSAPYLLTSITDEIGITSTINYTSGDVFSSLVTPYGTTSFVQSLGNTQDLSLQVTQPDGLSEYYMRRLDGVGVAATDSAVPSGYGLNITNNYLNYRDTYYWSKITVGQYGTPPTNDLGSSYYNVAHLYHFLHTPDGNSESGVLESERQPLESRVWYNYPGQSIPQYEGTSANPTVIARLLDDGTTQAYQYSYNTIGNVTQSIDPIGRTFTNSYYTNGIDLYQTTQTKSGSNQLLATYTWNNAHLPLTYVDAAGQTTSYTWNSLGQITSVTNAKGEVTTFTYYSANASGKQRLDRLYQIIGALPGGANTVTLDYDAYGNIASVTGPDGYVLQYAYDNLSRLTKVLYPDGTSDQTTYQYLDPLQQQDRLGRVTKYVYNSLRQLVTVTDPLNRTTNYGYCKCGHLAQIIDALGRSTTWSHDIEGRVTAKTYADGSHINYAYGSNSGRLISTTDEKGQVKTNSYNLDDTLAGITYTNATSPTPNVSFTYDPSYLRIATMTDGIGTTTYNYNPINAAIGAGQLASIVGPWANDTITYGYDALGRVVSRAINGTAETTTFDQAARITSMTNPLGTFTYGYDGATSRLTSAANSGGVKSTFSYYPNAQDHRLQNITNYKADGVTTLSVFNYTSDAENRILTWQQQTDTNTSTATTSTYSYDNADQLTGDVQTQRSTTTNTYAWQYDLAANRTDAKLNGVDTTFSYNDLNQLTNTSATLPAVTYQWDAEHRLVSVTKGTSTSLFSYDGLGRRVKDVEETSGTVTSTTTYIWDGLEMREQRDSTGGVVQQRYYSQGFQGVAGATIGTFLYTRDHLGSIREIVNPAGTLQERISYDDWGNPTFSDTTHITSFAYTGFFLHQPSGLQLAPYRAYDSTAARWQSRDPISENGGLNLYAYTNNSPINTIDQSGLFVIGALVDLGFGAVYGGLGALANGGDLTDVLYGAAIGGATGVAVGALDPTEGLLSSLAINGLVGGFSDALGQGVAIYRDPCKNFNYLEFGAATISGAIGGGISGFIAKSNNMIIGKIVGNFTGGVAGLPLTIIGAHVGNQPKSCSCGR